MEEKRTKVTTATRATIEDKPLILYSNHNSKYNFFRLLPSIDFFQLTSSTGCNQKEIKLLCYVFLSHCFSLFQKSRRKREREKLWIFLYLPTLAKSWIVSEEILFSSLKYLLPRRKESKKRVSWFFFFLLSQREERVRDREREREWEWQSSSLHHPFPSCCCYWSHFTSFHFRWAEKEK